MTFARQGRAGRVGARRELRNVAADAAGVVPLRLSWRARCSFGCGGGWPPALCAMSIAKNGKCGKWDKAAWPRVGCQLATARAELS